MHMYLRLCRDGLNVYLRLTFVLMCLLCSVCASFYVRLSSICMYNTTPPPILLSLCCPRLLMRLLALEVCTYVHMCVRVCLSVWGRICKHLCSLFVLDCFVILEVDVDCWCWHCWKLTCSRNPNHSPPPPPLTFSSWITPLLPFCADVD